MRSSGSDARDRQVKVRGFAREPAAIEAALLRHTEGHRRGGDRAPVGRRAGVSLVAGPVSEDLLRHHLAAHLPAYMIPRRSSVWRDSPSRRRQAGSAALPPPARRTEGRRPPRGNRAGGAGRDLVGAARVTAVELDEISSRAAGTRCARPSSPRACATGSASTSRAGDLEAPTLGQRPSESGGARERCAGVAPLVPGRGPPRRRCRSSSSGTGPRAAPSREPALHIPLASGWSAGWIAARSSGAGRDRAAPRGAADAVSDPRRDPAPGGRAGRRPAFALRFDDLAEVALPERSEHLRTAERFARRSIRGGRPTDGLPGARSGGGPARRAGRTTRLRYGFGSAAPRAAVALGDEDHRSSWSSTTSRSTRGRWRDRDRAGGAVQASSRAGRRRCRSRRCSTRTSRSGTRVASGEAHARQLAHWKQELAVWCPGYPRRIARGGAPVAALGTPGVPGPGGLRADLEQLSRREGATPFMTLMAAFLALLHRYTGQDDLWWGRRWRVVRGSRSSRCSARSSHARPARRPLRRPDVPRAPGPGGTALAAFAHQDVPFENWRELHPSAMRRASRCSSQFVCKRPDAGARGTRAAAGPRPARHRDLEVRSAPEPGAGRRWLARRDRVQRGSVR